MITTNLPNPISFDWDKGNKNKNWIKHQVQFYEAEEVFFNSPVIILNDIKHSQSEQRFHIFGITDEGRKLAIVYTIRENKVRVISAREMNRSEREYYEKQR